MYLKVCMCGLCANVVGLRSISRSAIPCEYLPMHAPQQQTQAITGDPIVLLLIAAATISTIIGVAVPEEREEKAWTEGIAIWVAVLIVTLVCCCWCSFMECCCWCSFMEYRGTYTHAYTHTHTQMHT